MNTKTPPSASFSSEHVPASDLVDAPKKRGRKPATRSKKDQESSAVSPADTSGDVKEKTAPKKRATRRKGKAAETAPSFADDKQIAGHVGLQQSGESGDMSASSPEETISGKNFVSEESAALSPAPRKRGRPRKNVLKNAPKDDKKVIEATKAEETEKADSSAQILPVQSLSAQSPTEQNELESPTKKRRTSEEKTTKTAKTPRKRKMATTKSQKKPAEISDSPQQNAAGEAVSGNKPGIDDNILSEGTSAAQKQGDNTIPSSEAGLFSFTDLDLSESILRAIKEMGYTEPTPIQAGAIPAIMAGHDVLGVAQTGTGKTASFILPLLEKLSNSRARARMPRALILEPTRELALQVAENFERYGKYLNLSHALLIGGGSMAEQRENLNRGVDVLIATPGRLLDLFQRGGLLLNQTDFLVIDEADRMLDMGFIPDIESIIRLLPRHRQTLFFSATMAAEIRHLADTFLKTPTEITIARQSSVASTISQWGFLLNAKDKQRALRVLLETESSLQNAIIFCNRKRDVDNLQAYLARNNFSVGHLHGDLNQSLRFETLERFRSGALQLLVCSDVAARGIDIDGLSHVFNFDLPYNAEDYVHRIGRTGRAGHEGSAFSFVTPDERPLLEAIEKLVQKSLEFAIIEGFETPPWDGESDIETSVEKNARKTGNAQQRETGSKNTAASQENEQPDAIIAIPNGPLVDGDDKTTQERTKRNRSSSMRGGHLPLDRNGFLPSVPEKEGLQRGFGTCVPEFIKISFPPQLRSFPVA